MRSRLAVSAVAIWFALTGNAGAAPTKTRPPQSGDQLLAHAVAAPQLQSYTVPVSLAVHLHKPIGIRTEVQATAYYRAPAQAALVITHATGLVGGFFKGAYKIDLVPQAWPRSYHVVSVARTVVAGAPVVELHAMPRTGAGDLTQVVFTLSAPALEPVSAEWDYTGGSSIRLSFVNGRVGSYTLPQQASISVDMPHDKLDADGTYGSYALNAPVDADVFTNAK
jgi:hypothetical protein